MQVIWIYSVATVGANEYLVDPTMEQSCQEQMAEKVKEF